MAWIVVTAVLVYGLHRLCLHLESRGWLYYTSKSRAERVSHALFAAIDPAARQIHEIQREEQEEAPDPGDPPWAQKASRLRR